jgi:hypothetical protein
MSTLYNQIHDRLWYEAEEDWRNGTMIEDALEHATDQEKRELADAVNCKHDHLVTEMLADLRDRAINHYVNRHIDASVERARADERERTHAANGARRSVPLEEI